MCHIFKGSEGVPLHRTSWKDEFASVISVWLLIMLNQARRCNSTMVEEWRSNLNFRYKNIPL